MANNSVKRARRNAKRVKPRKSRPKTFKTEESAKKYAEKTKLKSYELKDLKTKESKKKKIKIILTTE